VTINRTVLLAIVVPLSLGATGSLACAQQAAPPPAEASIGFGGAAGLGIPAPLVAFRLSARMGSRAGVDVDGGRVGPEPYFAAQLRVLRHPRGPSGRSLYFIFGATHIPSSIRTEFRFPDQTVVQVMPVSGLGAQLGVGWDWLSKGGVRGGIEAVTGGSEMVGPRLFIRAFVLWGPGRR
jgi:hypothetical protein